MPQTLPPKLLEPFLGQIQQRHDMGGMHLVLPVDLRPLRSGLWSLLLLSVGLTGFVTGPGFVVLMLVGLVPVGFILDRILVRIADAFSRGSRWARLGVLGGLVAWLGSTAAIIGEPWAAAAMLFLLVIFYGLFSLLTGRAPGLRLDERALTMTRHARIPSLRRDRLSPSRWPGREQKRVIALEQVESVRLLSRRSLYRPVKDLVLQLVDGEEVRLWCGPLRVQERTWLLAQIRERVRNRKDQLQKAGHDLTEAAVVPSALQALREPV